MWPPDRLLTFKKSVTLVRVCGLCVLAPPRLEIVLLPAALLQYCTALLRTALLQTFTAALLTFNTLCALRCVPAPPRLEMVLLAAAMRCCSTAALLHRITADI